MNNSFITFIVSTNFLDDQDLLLTVDSIRQQTDMCWMLEVRVVDVPDLPTITAFTHDNPRISVSEQSIKGNDDCQSTAIAVIPKGLELLPNACSEIKKAFDPALTPGSIVVYHRDLKDLSVVVAVERHLH